MRLRFEKMTVRRSVVGCIRGVRISIVVIQNVHFRMMVPIERSC